MNLLKKAILGGFSSLMLVAAANASYIDFTAAAFKKANNQNTFSYTNTSGIEILLKASQPEGSRLSYSSDGIGINSGFWQDWEQKQIGGYVWGREILDVEFLTGPVNLSQISLGQLYDEDLLGLEVAIYSINGGVENTISATDVNGFWALLTQDGIKDESVTINNVSRISFKSSADKNIISNFSLRGLGFELASVTEPESVPEPGMISLLGAGILALSGINFFRKKNN